MPLLLAEFTRDLLQQSVQPRIMTPRLYCPFDCSQRVIVQLALRAQALRVFDDAGYRSFAFKPNLPRHGRLKQPGKVAVFAEGRNSCFQGAEGTIVLSALDPGRGVGLQLPDLLGSLSCGNLFGREPVKGLQLRMVWEFRQQPVDPAEGVIESTISQ
jgi:hypothetical protein